MATPKIQNTSALYKWVMEFGPLIMNHQSSRAELFGADLGLSEYEYNALFLLAQRPQKGMTFEEVYQAAWEPPDETDLREEARLGMDKICREVEAHGRGMVRIVCPARNRYRYCCEYMNATGGRETE